MVLSLATDIPSLGLEPKETLGFESEEELEIVLTALTSEVIEDDLMAS